MANAELSKWAIEQAVKLHTGAGLTTDKLLAEAKALMEFVEPANQPSAPQES